MDRDDIRKYLCEFIGTFSMVFFAAGSIMLNDITGTVGPIGSGIASGAIITIVIYSFGHISGAHVNPALSIAALVVGKLECRLLPGYILSQMTGSAVAGLFLLWAIGDYGKMGANLPNFDIGATLGSAFTIEIILSIILMWVICGTAFSQSALNKFSGLAIGATVGIEVMVMGPYAGASMNPARAFGPYLANADFTTYWIYLLGPIIGMVLGAYIYLFTHHECAHRP